MTGAKLCSQKAPVTLWGALCIQLDLDISLAPQIQSSRTPAPLLCRLQHSPALTGNLTFDCLLPDTQVVV